MDGNDSESDSFEVMASNFNCNQNQQIDLKNKND
jgi:hypothetical protein